jgi:hypothetical protein
MGLNFSHNYIETVDSTTDIHSSSRAFRKSMTSRLAHSAAANQHNHGGLDVREGQNNLVRIYEMVY